MKFPVRIGAISDFKDLRNWLRDENFEFNEGGWTFYLPPQCGLTTFFPLLQKNYPADAGIKILKDLSLPSEARYSKNELNPAPGASLLRRSAHSPIFLLLVANYLFAHRLGVRVYDIVHLCSGTQNFTAYVVQHVNGESPNLDQHRIFLNKIRSILEQGEIQLTHWQLETARDFVSPDCNGNLMIDSKSGEAVYLDFQGFFIPDPAKIVRSISDHAKEITHFGWCRIFRGKGKYLYQTVPGLVPGKRDVGIRWTQFLDLFNTHGLALEKRVVFDIGCNTGLMLYYALSEGAQWAIGWDYPPVINETKRMLLALGATRFDLIGTEINLSTNFLEKIPQRIRDTPSGVLFYLAVSDHIGFPPGVGDLPWEYLIYEGHAGQTVDECLDRLHTGIWSKSIKVLGTKTFADGDSPSRAVLLCQRYQPYVTT